MPDQSLPYWYFDHQSWQALAGILGVFAASYFAWIQFKINRSLQLMQDVVEIYGRGTAVLTPDGNVVAWMIEILNVGSRLVYLSKLSLNGQIRETHGQILPPSNQPQISFQVAIPNDAADHLSLDVFYTDIEKRKWKTTIFADKNVDNNWVVYTRKKEIDT